MKRIGVNYKNHDGSGKFARVNHEKGRRLEDLHLHLADLEFSQQCLIHLTDVELPLSIPQTALWETAIVRFIKCFGGSAARFSLVAEQIYRSEPPEALDAFSFFKNYRNKHLVHDENPYAQSVLGALLNDPAHPNKIAELTCAGAIGGIFGAENYQNLSLLIEKAISWAKIEYEKIGAMIRADLEAMPYSELFAMESISFTLPKIEDIKRDRRNKKQPT